MSTQDGRYNYRPWNPPPRWTYNGPNATHEERITQEAISAASQDGQYLAETVRPPLPQIRLFPDRFGYDTTPMGIADIVSIDRRYRDVRVSWYSGGPASFTGAPRNSMEGGW